MKELAAGHDGVKTAVGAQARSGEDRPHEEARVRTREDMEDNLRSVSALSLSPHDMFLFVELTRSTQFRSSLRQIKKCCSE